MLETPSVRLPVTLPWYTRVPPRCPCGRDRYGVEVWDPGSDARPSKPPRVARRDTGARPTSFTITLAPKLLQTERRRSCHGLLLANRTRHPSLLPSRTRHPSLLPSRTPHSSPAAPATPHSSPAAPATPHSSPAAPVSRRSRDVPGVSCVWVDQTQGQVPVPFHVQPPLTPTGHLQSEKSVSVHDTVQ